MKNNNKGFTLIELLAVLLLLVIILLVSFPNFAGLSKKAKIKTDASTKLLIKSAAKIYVDNYQEDVDNYLNSHGSLCIPVGKLIAYEFVDADIKTSSGEEINPRKCVTVTKTTSNGKTLYEYDTSFENELPSGVDYIPPVLSLVPTTDNEGETNLRCSTITSATLENFKRYCKVNVTDNVDASIRVEDPIIYESKDDNDVLKAILVEYNATDATGNRAIPLKVQLNQN